EFAEHGRPADRPRQALSVAALQFTMSRWLRSPSKTVQDRAFLTRHNSRMCPVWARHPYRHRRGLCLAGVTHHGELCDGYEIRLFLAGPPGWGLAYAVFPRGDWRARLHHDALDPLEIQSPPSNHG